MTSALVHAPSEKTGLLDLVDGRFKTMDSDKESLATGTQSLATGTYQSPVMYRTTSADLEDGKAYTENNIPNPQENPNDGPNEAPISFADMGIPQGPSLQEGLTGKIRRFRDIPTLEKLYAVAMLCAILTLVSFTIYRLTQVSSKDADFVFSLVLLVNSLFCAMYVISAVKRERPTELLVLSIATILMVIYLIVNYAFGHQTQLKLVRMIIAIVLGIPLVIFGLKTACEYYVSRSLIFRTVGANSELQDLLQRLFFFQDVLKFDLELGVSMVILILTSMLSVDTKDIVILSTGGAMNLFWFLFGFFGFKRELKACVIFFPLGLPAIVYIIYKMYDVSHYIDSKSGLAAATIACACAYLVIRMIVLISGFIVYRGFGRGLKEKLCL